MIVDLEFYPHIEFWLVEDDKVGMPFFFLKSLRKISFIVQML